MCSTVFSRKCVILAMTGDANNLPLQSYGLEEMLSYIPVFCKDKFVQNCFVLWEYIAWH